MGEGFGKLANGGLPTAQRWQMNSTTAMERAWPGASFTTSQASIVANLLRLRLPGVVVEAETGSQHGARRTVDQIDRDPYEAVSKIGRAHV